MLFQESADINLHRLLLNLAQKTAYCICQEVIYIHSSLGSEMLQLFEKLGVKM